MVKGNNDFFSDCPSEQIFNIGDKKVLITHGHCYYVYRGTDELKRAARQNGVDIVMFGHTHIPHFEDEDGIVILNPGSVTYPRQAGRQPAYMIIKYEDGKMDFQQKFL